MVKRKRLNGATRWIMVFLAIGAIIYNSIVTHITMKNDVKHLQACVYKIEQEVRDIRNHLLDRK